MSLPLRIALRIIASIALVWALATYLPQYFVITGGWRGFVVIGLLLAVMNMIVRPLLSLLTAPLQFFATLLAFLVANGVFLWLALLASQSLDPTLTTFHIDGGIVGWGAAILCIGVANWILKIL